MSEAELTERFYSVIPQAQFGSDDFLAQRTCPMGLDEVDLETLTGQE